MASELGQIFGLLLYLAYATLAAGIVYLFVGLHRRPRATVLGVLGVVLFLAVRGIVEIPLFSEDVEVFVGVLFLGIGFAAGVVAFPEDSLGPFEHTVYTRFAQLVSVCGIVASGAIFRQAISVGLIGSLLDFAGEFPLQVSFILLILALPGIFGVYGLADPIRSGIGQLSAIRDS